jgi:hypothetical protein
MSYNDSGKHDEHGKHDHGGKPHEMGAVASPPAGPWTGAPLTLAQNASATIPQTANGSMFFVAANLTTQNNAGDIRYASGGAKPTDLPVPQLANQPSAVIANWGGQNLQVTNRSVATNTPIQIMAAGPGLPGMTTPGAIPATGTAASIGQYTALQGNAPGSWATLQFTSNTSNTSVIGVVGGPPDASGNNAYLIAINSASGNTGVASNGFGNAPSSPAPAGYYATTGSNTYNLGSFNWGSGTIWLVNLSGSSAANVSVTLVAD